MRGPPWVGDPADEIAQTRVEATFVGGQRVFGL